MAAWRACVLLGAGMVALSFTLPVGLPRDAQASLAGLAAAAVVATAAHRATAGARAWWWMAVGLALWGVGDLAYCLLSVTRSGSYSAWWVDLVYLLGYGPVLVGIAVLVRARGLGPDRWGTLLDSGVLTVGAGLVTWQFLVSPALSGATETTVASTTFPLADAVVLGALGLAATASPRSVLAAGWARLLGAAVLVLLVTDLGYAGTTVAGTYQAGSVVEAGWLVSYALWAAAALHPSLREPDEGTRARPSGLVTLTTGRATMLTVALLSVPLTLVVQRVVHGPGRATTPAVVALVLLVALLVTRVATTVRRAQALARTDALTGLVDRRRFTDLLEDSLRRPGRGPVALLLVDVDDVAEVNDTVGLAAGDALIAEVAGRVRTLAGPTALVARVGGDEFGVLVDGGDAEALTLAHHLHTGLGRPVVVSGVALPVDVGVGLAVAPRAPGPQDATRSAGTVLLHRAGAALAEARAGGGRVVAFRPDLERAASERVTLLGELRRALGTDELQVHHQLQVDLASGRVRGVEALVRWDHPRWGLLTAETFLPAAERTSLVTPLARQVLAVTLAQLHRWRAAGADLTASVNISALTLRDPALPGMVRGLLAEHAVPAERLVLEVTETSLIADLDRARSVLAELRLLGVRTSLDDYGQGHSSLSYLRQLPLDELKLDRSFVTGMATDRVAATIVRSTIELAHELGLVVVAEGVEDAAVLDALRGLGCDAAQGFFLGRPVPAAELDAVVLGGAVLGGPVLGDEVLGGVSAAGGRGSRWVIPSA